MAITIENELGEEVEVFLTYNGFVDAIVRADTKDDFDAAALAYGIYRQVTDEETGVTSNVPNPGVNVSVLGPVVITAGEYDEEGNVITEPVLDNRYHVNLRLAGESLNVMDANGLPRWKNMGIAWTVTGTDDANPNKNEVGKVLQKVCLIDPDTVATPQRGWL